MTDDNSTQCTYYNPDTLFSCLADHTMSFNVIHINIRSYKKNFDEFVMFLNQTGLQYSVIVLTETWLTEDSSWQEMLGFKSYHSIRRGKAGGRVTILVNDSCRSTKIDHMSINSPSAEILTIGVETGNESFTVFGVYRPPLSSVSSFGDILGNILHARSTPNNSIIIGDLNIDSLSNSLTQDEEFIVDLLKSCVIFTSHFHSYESDTLNSYLH